MAIKSKDKIYFDTDCLSSFLWTDSMHILISLYGNRVVVPTRVEQELKNVEYLHEKLRALINRGLVKTETFAIGTDEFKIYGLLRTGDNQHPRIDDGEAAVIALAKCNDATMASNNLRDIKYYIDYYKLNNITTADILFEAWQNNVIIKAEAEELWQRMRRKKRKFPYDTFEEWVIKTKEI